MSDAPAGRDGVGGGSEPHVGDQDWEQDPNLSDDLPLPPAESVQSVGVPAVLEQVLGCIGWCVGAALIVIAMLAVWADQASEHFAGSVLTPSAGTLPSTLPDLYKFYPFPLGLLVVGVLCLTVLGLAVAANRGRKTRGALVIALLMSLVAILGSAIVAAQPLALRCEACVNPPCESVSLNAGWTNYTTGTGPITCPSQYQHLVDDAKRRVNATALAVGLIGLACAAAAIRLLIRARTVPTPSHADGPAGPGWPR